MSLSIAHLLSLGTQRGVERLFDAAPNILSGFRLISLSSIRITFLSVFVVSFYMVVLFGLYCGLAITVLTDRDHRLQKGAKINLRYQTCRNIGDKVPIPIRIKTVEHRTL